MVVQKKKPVPKKVKDVKKRAKKKTTPKTVAVVKRVGGGLTGDDRLKGAIASAEQRALQKTLKELVASGDISDLQAQTLNNWAELLSDTDKQVRAFATKEISKYQFATKKEIIKFPEIIIKCEFIGIGTNDKKR